MLRRFWSVKYFYSWNAILPSKMSTEASVCVDNSPGTLKRLSEDVSETSPAKIARVEGSRIKRRKYAVLLSYCGLGYLGLQRNPGMKTIEEDVLSALLKAGHITEEGYNQPQSIQFQRAARTDKGVSAVRQVLSLKLPEEVDLEAVNKNLLEQIRVFSIKRVTKGFNSKSNCDARTYMYMMPTFALSPKDCEVSKDYRIPKSVVEKTNEIMKHYTGTHNYHNFTSRRKATDPSSKRYIISFTCGEPEIVDDMEFITLRVKGQSFMLHQIRKMVGLVIAIVRGFTTIETLAKAWEKERIDLPVAPSLGLVLEEAHYDRYNLRFGDDGIHEPIEWSSIANDLEEFRKKYILSTIFKTEKEENSMMNWLENLPGHSYDVRSEDKNSENIKDDGEESREGNSSSGEGKIEIVNGTESIENKVIDSKL